MKGKTHDLNHDLIFSAHTINCVCHSIRSMFRVLGIYNFAPWFKNSWLKSPGLKSSRLKSLGLKGPGLKLGVEKPGVEMSFNLLALDLKLETL